VNFHYSGDQINYVVWFNHSLTFNTTQDVDENYGLRLQSILRGFDEAISTIFFSFIHFLIFNFPY